ncbi:MAG TPA: MarP family serine protease [Actinomycetota bacterium]|nr:MarP family serine protease [Actinomycetota bacterium]
MGRWIVVSILDVFLLALLVLTAVGGYRRGALRQVFGLAGVTAGVGIGLLLGPSLGESASDPLARVAIVLGVVVVAACAGNVAGYLVAGRVRKRLEPQGAAAVADRVVGVGISVVAMVLAVWFLALNLANGPLPTVARSIRDSRLVAAMAQALPAPPPLVPQLERFADALGFPDVFVGLPSSGEPAELPSSGTVRAAAAAASRSTVQVFGDGCAAGYLNEGSGFVAEPGLVVTNAHVVAGTAEVSVRPDGQASLEATVVAFDPRMDLAVIRVPELTAPPLPLETAEQPRGTGGAVLGYPGSEPLVVVPAAVRRAFEPTGRDIYGRGEVERRLYELDATVRGGNSGGPFVLRDGRVAGVVFANSVLDDHVGYAIAASEVLPILDAARTLTAQAGVGSCAP